MHASLLITIVQHSFMPALKLFLQKIHFVKDSFFDTF